MRDIWKRGLVPTLRDGSSGSTSNRPTGHTGTAYGGADPRPVEQYTKTHDEYDSPLEGCGNRGQGDNFGSSTSQYRSDPKRRVTRGPGDSGPSPHHPQPTFDSSTYDPRRPPRTPAPYGHSSGPYGQTQPDNTSRSQNPQWKGLRVWSYFKLDQTDFTAQCATERCDNSASRGIDFDRDVAIHRYPVCDTVNLQLSSERPKY
jgi:hypothetical protein